MHWVDRQMAQVRVGQELARRGWRLWGYDPGGWDGNSGQDYPELPHFDGVATKGDAVACIGISQWTVRNRSGQAPIRFESVETGLCLHCEGSGAEPGGWTLQEACQNPVAYNLHRVRPGCIPGLPNVVSPLEFLDNGRERCRECGGSGRTYETRQVQGETWPVFQAHPPRRTWHVERGGKIIASGVGLERCAHDTEEGRQAVKALVDKIEAALTQAPSSQKESPASSGDAVTARLSRDRAWTWLRFSKKPPQPILEALRLNGWSWSNRREAWYHTGGAEPPEEILPLLRGRKAGA